MKNIIDYIMGDSKKKTFSRPKVTRGKNIPQKRFLKETPAFNMLRFKDSDGDGVINGLDCFPFDKSRHDVWNPLTNRWRPDPVPVPDHVRDRLNHSLNTTNHIMKHSPFFKRTTLNQFFGINDVEEGERRHMIEQQRLAQQMAAQQQLADRQVRRSSVDDQFGAGVDTDQLGL